VTIGQAATAISTAEAPASTGADLLGWSALPLLADAAAEGSWLFVLGPLRASRSSDPLADARFAGIDLPASGLWPFADSSLQGVVIDGDALGAGADEAAILRCLGEAARCVVNERNILVVCGERRMPRNLRELRGYRRPGANLWRSAVADLGGPGSSTPVAFASFDGNRLTGLRLTRGIDPASGDRPVLRVSPSSGADDSALSSMVSDASRALKAELRIDRVAVRKIGKTAVFVTGTDGGRHILRIARSPIARRRAVRNFNALDSMRACSLSDRLTAVIPRALGRGACGSYEYFLEACLSGEAGPSRHAPRRSGWAAEAVDYISLLHQETARRVVVDDGLLERIVGGSVATIVRTCATPAAERTLDRLTRRCEDSLRGRIIPMVRTHGDFTETNCLFDTTGRLVGVVDWELSEPDGLPLLDLLQLMPVEGENGRSERWQRFDAWMGLLRHPERVISDDVLGSYVRTLQLDPESIAGLVLVHWLNHVADRLDARRDDERWMRLRVRQPLESLEGVLCD
jgi:hypothetical protein